ncbi:MAG TPA: RNA 3'-terminal phosphate cyclase [Candidatus Binataceae bacterium]|nr:RNA 3'-terminal phosphate cyclase [Candidatus Binataceae bacterium]
MIEIDGAFGEGGGQIVRTACSLSALSGRATHIVNIRQARREPGLRLQHLLAVRALAELCGGSVEGAEVGSRELVFRPGRMAAKEIAVQIGTAASITLIVQCLIPAIHLTQRTTHIVIRGGATDTAFAPPLDYVREVFLWFLRRAGVAVNISAAKRGYYPRGGAEVEVEIAPARPRPIIATERGRLKEIRVLSSAASVLKNRKVAERQIEGAVAMLGALPIAPKTSIEYASSHSAGSAMCIVAEFEKTVVGASALGARGKMAEKVGLEAAENFLAEFNSTGCLDRHMADQILPYMALAPTASRVTVTEVTEHCRTNMWVIEKFVEGRFEVEERMIEWSPARTE